jgi:exonuclease SbcC
LNQLESVQHKLQLFIQLKQELVQLQAELENTSQTQKKLETQTEATQQRYQHAKTEREQLQQVLQQRLLHAKISNICALIKTRRSLCCLWKHRVILIVMMKV